MTVHMIRLYSEPPKNNIHFQRMKTACETWAASYTEALPSQRLPLTYDMKPDSTIPDHTIGNWRFEMTVGADTLLADLAAGLQSEVGWYRLKYHECPLDEENLRSCDWDETLTREYGTVPSGIP